MLKILKLTVFLAVIAGLSGAALSLVYQKTEPVIEAATLAEEKESLAQIYGDIDYTLLETDLDDYETIEDVYQAEDQGYVYKCSVYGYSSSTPITFLIAIDQNGQYDGYEVIDASGETSGIGSKVADEDFGDRIVGKTVSDDIDTISGATISSSAVISAIDEACDHFSQNYE